MILEAVKTVKGAIIAAVIVGVAGVVGTLYVKNLKAGWKIEELNLQVSNLQNDVFKEQIRASGYKIVIEQLEETYSKIEKTRRITADIDKEITDAPPEEDGALAPVLRRTLDSVGRMLANP